ncbi:MAG: hypothetical protein R6V39_09495, partial [Desulfovibrionales bacterium]
MLASFGLVGSRGKPFLLSAMHLGFKTCVGVSSRGPLSPFWRGQKNMRTFRQEHLRSGDPAAIRKSSGFSQVEIDQALAVIRRL